MCHKRITNWELLPPPQGAIGDFMDVLEKVILRRLDDITQIFKAI